MAVAFGACAAAILALVPPSGSRWIGQLTRAGAAAILALAAFQCVLAADYAAYPGYLDFVEPATAAIAWLAWHGSPIYPPMTSGQIYAPVYGPFLYQAAGLPLILLGPSIAVSKIPGLAAFAGAHGLTCALLRRGGARVGEALTITAAQCLIQAGFARAGYAFGVRGDPCLFFLAAAATFVATAPPSAARAIILGAVAAAAANIKADGALYIVPVAVWFLYQAPAAARARLAALGAVAGTILFAAPFSAGNVSVANYLGVLAFSAHRTYSRWVAEQVVVMMALLLAPLLWAWLCCRPPLPRGLVPFVVLTALCMGIIIVPASADGAGPHHLLPFLPSVSWAFWMLVQAARQHAQGAPRRRLEMAILAMAAALVAGYAPIAVVSWDPIVRTYAAAPLAREANAELGRAIDAFPGQSIAVAPGMSYGFDAASTRALAVFRGEPLLIDPSAWWDVRRDSNSETVVRRIVRDCRAAIWLLPHGAGFGASRPPGETMFSRETMNEFARDYRLLAAGTVYDIWRCGRPPPQ